MHYKELLNKLKKVHLETYTHSLCVEIIAVEFANNLKLSDEDIKIISISSLLHDAGKYYIPTSILSKKGRLTDEEFEVIKKHPEYGLLILSKLQLDEYEKYRKEIGNVIISHHINTQNSYPAININKSIYADIISIADCYAALTEKRDYKEAFTVNKSLEIMESSNGYNREILQKFTKYIKSKNFEHILIL